MHVIKDTTLLDNIWKRFHAQHRDDVAHCVPYCCVHRNARFPQQFEDWLFTKGGTVVQIKHRRFLAFNNKDNATMFLLTEV